MKCIQCDQEARAICKFCGRAVCKDHVRQQRYASGFATKLGFWGPNKNGVVVPDAVWCGTCHPEYSATA